MSKKSKLFTFISSMMVFISSVSLAQHVELTAFAGGTFAAGINSYSTNYYKAQIGGSWHYGGTLDFFVRPNTSINITVFNQPTIGYLYGQGVYKNINAPMNLTYFLAGFNRYFGPGKIKGYGGLGIGAVDISATGYRSATKFAVDIHGGVKIDASKNVGLRLQVQLDAPVDGGGFGIGIGGGGAAVGISTYSSILQFGGNAGIVFRFGQNK